MYVFSDASAFKHDNILFNIYLLLNIHLNFLFILAIKAFAAEKTKKQL